MVLRFYSGALRGRIAGAGIFLLAFNLAAWAWALLAFARSPLLLGTAALAYGFGLRHGVDADHIAAIDNVTRNLMQEGKRPVSIGLFFALGHSTIVVALSVALAATAAAFQHSFGHWKAAGSLVATAVSAFFLFAIAGANLFILSGVWRRFQGAARGRRPCAESAHPGLAGGGLMARVCGRLFALVRRPSQMAPLGALFGLGFDTATEVGVLGLSAMSASQGLGIGSILVFPALFSAGMALIDWADGILMLGAYGWAFVKPIRKLYYNLTITLASILVAIAVGGLEILGLIESRLKPVGAFWRIVGEATHNFAAMGYAIIGVFALSWLISFVIYRVRGYDRIETGA
jgi:nickel/cobalt transporter (NiCoT) family protein